MTEGRSSLARRLTTFDAVVIGLSSMIGAGVFAAVGPAAESAGNWLLAGLALAGIVAFANATSSAQLAAIYQESGGTYVFARKRLGEYWGFLAGWGFIVGKSASLGAMALTFGAYAYPQRARPLAVAAVMALTVVNYRGVEKTARLARVIVALVLITLLLVVAAVLGGGHASSANLTASIDSTPLGVLRSAGLLFFAFAGYARIATMAEEVRNPERTIPRAIPIALALTTVIYAVVMASALAALGPRAVGRAEAPLAAAVEAGRWSSLAPAIRFGAAIASLGVLLSLMAGVSRTVLSMARRSEMPKFLSAVHKVHRTPHVAEVAVAVVVCMIVLTADVRGVIGFSSFAVLTYYALTNASAFTLSGAERRWPRGLAAAGAGGCVLLAFTLPIEAIVGGLVLFTIGSIAWLVLR